MAQQPPQGGPPPDSVVLQKFSGLKNVVDLERLQPDELAIAQNIDLDDVGQIHRRRGYSKKLAGNCHSLFTASDGTVYVVKDGVLGILRPSYAFVPLQAGIGDQSLAYVQVGPSIYFSSQQSSGRINQDGTVSPWGAEVSAGTWLSPVVNPTATLPEIGGRLLGKPKMATALAYWNGRIYMAQGRTLWATELYVYDYVDRTKNYKYFEDDITVIGAVTDGLYVGTQGGVYWLSGIFNEMKRLPLQSSGAVPGSLVYVPADMVDPTVPQDQYIQSKNAVVFMTGLGLMAGLDSGNLYNLSGTDFLFPDATNAAALFRRQDGVNQYVGVLDSDGSPQNAARFGDYVDAEIRRAGTWIDLADTVRFGETLTVVKV